MFVVKSVEKETREDRGALCVVGSQADERSVGQGGGMGSQSANASPGGQRRNFF